MKFKTKKILKRLIFFLLIAFISITIYLYFILQMVDIEDRYGDLQNLYWNSKNNDIAVNLKNNECAIIEKFKNRIYVVKNGEKIDIEYWLNHSDVDYNVEIYRPKEKKDIKYLNSEQLRKIIHKADSKLVEKIHVKY